MLTGKILSIKTYKLIGGNGKPFQSPTKGVLGGNTNLKIYGRLDCPSALRWIRKGEELGKDHYVKTRVFFKDEKTAIEAGYRPCAICMRKQYKLWKK